ncbi:MAG: hypothetical protein M1825_003638 [Sarcosagium campestre]|nr:MAG: hypothetical protein M1825_003638 [Sarcosagium campestre]
MSFGPQTPQRPLPGTFLKTPAASRQVSASNPTDPFGPLYPSLPKSNDQITISKDASLPLGQPAPAPTTTEGETLKPIERAARVINETLIQESRFPELDSYVGQGISSDYDIVTSPAWAPFQSSKSYEIPERIFEQYNQAQVSTLMGLFASYNLAWITIDNALYLWDFTRPNPELSGFEDQPNSITAVNLLKPKPGVFLPAISHILAIATTAEIVLVGLSFDLSASGTRSINLYQTKMALSVKGMHVNLIQGSSASGRIFFTSKGDNDVYELTYQQEEKWFYNRCAKVNHTARGLASLTPSLTFRQRTSEHPVQMVIDDSRDLLYTLSSSSGIRTFYMTPPNGLEFTIDRSLSEIFSNIGHMTSRTELLAPGVYIVSIQAISANEATKLHLMATTSTGCRLFMSATAASSFLSGSVSGKPTSMQVQHIKFPPPRAGTQSVQTNSPGQRGPYQGPAVDTASKALANTRMARRFPPGYFFCFVPNAHKNTTDSIFVSAPDSGRINRPHDLSQVRMTAYQEQAMWLPLESRAEDVGVLSPPFGASSRPAGFGNELAIQFDMPSSEFAILTNTGIHTYRRRRLVDMFASAIRHRSGEETVEADVKKFIRLYGRGETTATALAVTCGQGQDVTADSRVARIMDPDVIEAAWRTFIEYGGKPVLNEDSVIDQTALTIDNVRPSPRHDGIALYISRLVRSIWKAHVVLESTSPTGGLAVKSSVSSTKLLDIQRDLTKLQDFLEANRSFIDGLAGPESLLRVSTRQDEIALQAEHRALHALLVLVSSIIEGISFVLVLFDERVEEILLSIADTTRQQVRNLSFEGLFATAAGKDLAKELVKAIVNRNIANGANVDTVAEALRRRCGSFCSADDVIIFKAQEQIKRAQEAGGTSDFGRRLLNESLRLLQQVAGSLSMEHLNWAIDQYLAMQFYAGGIQLALNVAKETDRGNRALAWINDGRPLPDARQNAFAARQSVYRLIHRIIVILDDVSRNVPQTLDGNLTDAATRRNEANHVIDNSNDEVFQFTLYDWYLEQGWADRLLGIQSTYVASYLQGKAKQSLAHADLLWRYFSQQSRYFEAATVQLQLAKSDFAISLEKRIEYLSKARANASTSSAGIDRVSRQALLREVSELLDVANIQDDLLARLRNEPRLKAQPEREAQVLQQLDGKVIGLTEVRFTPPPLPSLVILEANPRVKLYNNYADQASYYDICLLIYQAADHRNTAHIGGTWQNLIEQVHAKALRDGQPQPYEAIAEKVRSLGSRLGLSENTFPIPILLPLLERYSYEHQRDVAPPEWVIDIFLDLHAPPETLLASLESIYFNDEAPFRGRNRRPIATDIVRLCRRWYSDTKRSPNGPFGGDLDETVRVSETLGVLLKDNVGAGAGTGAGAGAGAGADDAALIERCRTLRDAVDQHLR